MTEKVEKIEESVWTLPGEVKPFCIFPGYHRIIDDQIGKINDIYSDGTIIQQSIDPKTDNLVVKTSKRYAFGVKKDDKA